MIHLISHHPPHILLMMASQSIFACFVFYLFYSSKVMVLMHPGMPEQLGNFAASGASIAPLNPVKFPAWIHWWEPVGIVRWACLKSIAAGFAGIHNSVVLTFVLEHLIIFCCHISDDWSQFVDLFLIIITVHISVRRLREVCPLCILTVSM